MTPRTPRRVTVTLAAGGLALLGTLTATTVHVTRIDAAGSCGGAAADLFGKFVAKRQSPPKEETLTVTFSTPNAVASDEEATANGQPAGSAVGKGTFSLGPPLKWTDAGTYRIPGKPDGTYNDTFTASAGGVKCTTGTTVSSITGTWAEANNKTVPETYTRQP